MTAPEPDRLDRELAAFKSTMQWHPTTPDDVKTYVLRNLNGFVAHLRRAGCTLTPEQAYERFEEGKQAVRTLAAIPIWPEDGGK